MTERGAGQKKKVIKVLHLPTSVGGNSWGLAQGEKKLGLDSKVLVALQNVLNYNADINLNIQNINSNLIKLLKLIVAFYTFRSKFDVFHFNFGSSLIHSFKYNLNLIDLPYYPKKSKLFATYNGCDARQKFPSMKRTAISPCHNQDCYFGQCNSGKRDLKRRRDINKMAQYVNHIWALNPDLLYFLPSGKSSFLPYSLSLKEIRYSKPKFSKKLTIVHAPTNRSAKGSEIILSALTKLKAKYKNQIEVKIIENVPHRQALQLYQTADLVIDQILIGWYGGFAVEMMAMGKPVIARIAKEDLHFIPPRMANDVQEAIINANPENIYNVLERCVEDKNFLMEKVKIAQEYVYTWHDPLYVARITKEKYESF